MRLTEKRAFKDQVYGQCARQVRAMGNPHRLEILDLLAQGERTVEDVARETGQKIGSASQHLLVLRASGLLHVRREGLYSFYRLADEHVYMAWRTLRELIERQSGEIDRIVRTY